MASVAGCDCLVDISDPALSNRRRNHDRRRHGTAGLYCRWIGAALRFVLTDDRTRVHSTYPVATTAVINLRAAPSCSDFSPGLQHASYCRLNGT